MANAAEDLLVRITVLESIMRGLIAGHPDADRLRRDLRQMLQEQRDAGLFSDAPEAIFEAWDRAVARYLL